MPDNLDYWFREHQFRRRLIAHERRERHALRHQCNHCHKISETDLRACSACKSVRYCDRSCQISHYKNGHKGVCQKFREPPITAFFMVDPLPDSSHPPHPIIGHATEEGLGMWVSIDGSIDCELQPLIFPMRPPAGPFEIEERRRQSREDPRTTTQYKAYANTLLTLKILVQNRSETGELGMVFAGRTFIQCLPEFADSVMFTYLGTADRCLLDESTGVVRCAPARDPFTNRPRVCINNFNGHEIRDDAFLPSAVIDAEQGIFLLGRGDFAILHVQFRLGDGTVFWRELEALTFTENLFLPILSGIKQPSAEDRARMQYLARQLNDDFDADFCDGLLPDEGLYAAICHEEVSEHYIDFCGLGIQEGRRAFVESHFGREQAERWERIRRTLVRRN